MISEPMTMITDYALGAVSAVLGWRLYRDAREERARKFWGLAFGALAVSALLGGTHHGFAAMMSQATYAISWKVTVVAIGVFSFGMMAGSMLATTHGALRAGLLAIAGVQLVVYTAWMLVHDEFRYVVLDSAIAMSTLLLLHAWSAASRGDRASYWALSAIAVSAVAAAVQFFRVTLHQHFNHNDLYHLIQIAGMALFFRGGKLLRDRSGQHGNMKSDHVLCLSSKSFHRMHYVEWGDPDAERVVICVHGLTRNCRDFDYLAQALLPEFRVVCPDVAGRGQSDWLPAKDDYGYPQYCADMTALIARVTAGGRPRRIYWVGTSMGGIFGMLLASRPKSPLEKLVLNDVGTFIPGAALERIGTYVGRDPRFKTLEEMETMVRFVSAPFGPLTDAQWRHLTVSGAKQHADGSWGFCYDPGIGIPFQKKPLADVDLWQFWDAIACPTLLLRGAQSDLLPKDAAIAMTRRGPRPRLIEFEGVGHAPMLMADDQIKVVREFLLEG